MSAVKDTILYGTVQDIHSFVHSSKPLAFFDVAVQYLKSAIDGARAFVK